MRLQRFFFYGFLQTFARGEVEVQANGVVRSVVPDTEVQASEISRGVVRRVQRTSAVIADVGTGDLRSVESPGESKIVRRISPAPKPWSWLKQVQPKTLGITQVFSRKPETMNTIQPQEAKEANDAFNAVFTQWKDKEVYIVGDSIMREFYLGLHSFADWLQWEVVEEPSMTTTCYSFDALAVVDEVLENEALACPAGNDAGISHRRTRISKDGVGFMLNLLHYHKFYPVPTSTTMFPMETLLSKLKSADVTFINLGHVAIQPTEYSLDDAKSVARQFLRAAEASHISSLVFFEHPPSHFDQENGDFYAMTECCCKCQPAEVMHKQFSYVFEHEWLAPLAHSKGFKTAAWFDDLIDKCDYHRTTADCRHFAPIYHTPSMITLPLAKTLLNTTREVIKKVMP